MSEKDPTTKPTIETVLDRIDALRREMSVRMDRIESLALTTRGEMLSLRADFTELRDAIKEHFPAIQ